MWHATGDQCLISRALQRVCGFSAETLIALAPWKTSTQRVLFFFFLLFPAEYKHADAQ